MWAFIFFEDMGHVLLCLEEMGHFSAALVDRNYGLAWPARARVCVSKKRRSTRRSRWLPCSPRHRHSPGSAPRPPPSRARVPPWYASTRFTHAAVSLSRHCDCVPHRRFAARSADGRIPNLAGVKAASPEFSHIVKHRYSRRK